MLRIDAADDRYLKELLVDDDEVSAAAAWESPPPPPSSPSPSPPPPAETCDCNDADASDECKLTCETLDAAVGIAADAHRRDLLPIVGCLLLIIALCVLDKKAAVGAPAQPTAALKLPPTPDPIDIDQPSDK